MSKHFGPLWIFICILLSASAASTQTVNKGTGAVSNITPVLYNVVQVASAFGDTAAECESDSKCIKGGSYVYTGGPLGDNEGVFAFSFNREFLKGELKTPPPSRSKIFTVYKDWILDTEACKKLGFRSVTIKSKQYKWDRSKNPYGTINFEVRTVK